VAVVSKSRLRMILMIMQSDNVMRSHLLIFLPKTHILMKTCRQTIKASNGAETGMKGFEKETNCVVVTKGTEGFCKSSK
ncbi:MAG: hypothetical protein ABI539_04870, partial [Acidobacteriota bacterium]